MKNKFLNKIFLVLVFLNGLLFVSAVRRSGNVDVGAVGPGAPDPLTPAKHRGTPIDMYTTILFIVAVSIILGVYFYQRRKNILAK